VRQRCIARPPRYYGVAGNIRALFKVHRVTERYWHRMLCSRSWAARRMTWDTFNQIKKRTPLLRPKLRLPYRELASTRSAVNQVEERGARWARGNLPYRDPCQRGVRHASS